MKLSHIFMQSAIAVACSLTLFSCADFLDIKPKTFVSEDNFWNEKTDIDQMVAGCYTSMQGDAFLQRCIMWGETRSDNIVDGQNVTDQTNIYRTLKENLMSTNAYTDWASFYAVINQCNIIIERAPEVSQKDPVYTESDVRATIAEMKTLRSLCYFYLVRAFKDVPYYTDAVQSESDVRSIAAANGDSIVRCLITDLEGCVGDALKAYPKDSGTGKNSTKNRITQNAIYSLLADMCLWNGDYAKTVAYAQKVIDAKRQEFTEDYSHSISSSNGNVMSYKHTDDTFNGTGFPLYPCFSGNSYGNDFNQTFGGSQNGFESIFELAFNNTSNDDPNYINNTAFASLYGNHYTSEGNAGKGFLAVSEDIVGDVASGENGKLFTRHDVRYYTNLYNEKLKDNDLTSAFVNKYVAYDVEVSAASGMTLPFVPTFMNLTYANRNFIFYRLTDVMLMQAEALAELGSADEEGKLDDNLKRAFYIVWAVNRRSIMVPSATTSSNYELQLKSYSSQDMIRELVLRERRVELMFEGKRWFDLLRQCHRTGTTDYIRSRVGAKGSSSSSSNLFTNYESLYWPYNKYELKNNNLLIQKPYYGSEDEDSFESTK